MAPRARRLPAAEVASLVFFFTTYLYAWDIYSTLSISACAGGTRGRNSSMIRAEPSMSPLSRIKMLRCWTTSIWSCRDACSPSSTWAERINLSRVLKVDVLILDAAIRDWTISTRFGWIPRDNTRASRSPSIFWASIPNLSVG